MADTVFLPDERMVYALRELYRSYGYRHFKVSKFEEYDLYADNKSFLTDSNILTFTDTDGRLMALKPDITLSIIKNTKDSGGMHKVFYNENVYRTNGGGFREIMQTGLEALGDIDLYCVCEVLMLAYKSLETISSNFLLEMSHMGFVSGIIDEITDNPDKIKALLKAVSQKNTAEIKALCADADKRAVETLCRTVLLYGTPKKCFNEMKEMILNGKMRDSFDELSETVSVLGSMGITDNLRLDFSITNDMRYYNGIIFKGYIDGVADSVLSGGRYDRLVMDMGKKGGAIGFAVYLDELNRLFAKKSRTDADVLLIYDRNTDPACVAQRMKELIASGKTVRAQKNRDTDFRAAEVIDITGGQI